MKDILLLIYWYPFKWLVQRLQPQALYRLARLLGAVAYHTLRRRRAAYARELADIVSIPPASREFGRIVKEAFVNQACLEFEMLRFPTLNPATIAAFVECTGLEHLDRARDRGKGSMLLFGHFGANQMVMAAIGYRGYTMSQMSAPVTVWIEKLPNRKFSAMEKKALELRWAHELSLPVTHINIFGSLKEAFRCLRRNEILGIAVDGGGGRDRVEVPFLGRRALISKGAIDIAMRTGCAVLPTFMVRGDTGKNTMIIEAPLDIQQGGDEEASLRRNLRLFMERFEQYVVRHPSHYLGFLALRRFMELQGDTPLFLRGESAG